MTDQIVVEVPVVAIKANHHDDIKPFVDGVEVAQARSFLTGASHPKAYYSVVVKTLTRILDTVEAKTARELLDAIEKKYIAAIQAEFDASNLARKNKDTKAVKPADLFRKYHKDLKAIWQRNGQFATLAHGLFIDIYAESTLTEGDLMNPDYVDPYTNLPVAETVEELAKALPDLHEPGLEELIRWIDIAPAPETDELNKTVVPTMSRSQHELIAWANQCRKDLGWDDATVAAFIKANSSGFDAESDEEPETFDEMAEGYTPPTMLPKDTLTLNRELWYSASDAIRSFNKCRSYVFKEMQEKTIEKGRWHAAFRIAFTKTAGFLDALDALERIAEEDVVTAAAVYIRLAGDFGLMEEDVAQVRGVLPNGNDHAYISMLDYAREWEDDLLEVVQDSLDKGFPMSERDIVGFDILNNGAFEASMPEMDPNPIKTASWNRGFVEAASAGATWQQAEEAGWNTWREAMDPKAAQQYNGFLVKTGNRKGAMTVFWRVCDKRVPRPMSMICAIRKSGLTIWPANKAPEQCQPEELRFIDWNIVALKIRGNELDLRDGRKEKLLARLKELGYGQQVWKLLE